MHKVNFIIIYNVILVYIVHFSDMISHLVQLEIDISCSIWIVAAIDDQHISPVLRMSTHYVGFHLKKNTTSQSVHMLGFQDVIPIYMESTLTKFLLLQWKQVCIAIDILL